MGHQPIYFYNISPSNLCTIFSILAREKKNFHHPTKLKTYSCRQHIAIAAHININHIFFTTIVVCLSYPLTRHPPSPTALFWSLFSSHYFHKRLFYIFLLEVCSAKHLYATFLFLFFSYLKSGQKITTKHPINNNPRKRWAPSDSKSSNIFTN